MPKRGWKWRTESLKSLSVDETVEWLRTSRVTPKLARWVYRRYADGPYDWAGLDGHEPEALRVIWSVLVKLDSYNVARTGSNPGWIRPFLWRELFRHKGDILGEVIAEFGYVYASDCDEAAGRLMDLYEDDSAHPFTRGNVLYALCSAEVPPDQVRRFRRILRHALSNTENPYARGTACMLALQDPTIRAKDIEPLLTDRAGLKPWWGPTTVSDYARETYGIVKNW